MQSEHVKICANKILPTSANSHRRDRQRDNLQSTPIETENYLSTVARKPGINITRTAGGITFGTLLRQKLRKRL